MFDLDNQKVVDYLIKTIGDDILDIIENRHRYVYYSDKEKIAIIIEENSELKMATIDLGELVASQSVQIEEYQDATLDLALVIAKQSTMLDEQQEALLDLANIISEVGNNG